MVLAVLLERLGRTLIGSSLPYGLRSNFVTVV
jgi:hypothetical protein